MKPLLTAIALIFLPLAANNALAGKSVATTEVRSLKATSVSVFAKLPEAQEVIRATRALEAKLETGLNYRDYSQEIGNLNVSLVALDEVLEEKGETQIRAQIASMKLLHKEALSFWSECIKAPRDCSRGYVSTSRESPTLAGLHASIILSMYPEHESLIGSVVSTSTVLNAIWSDTQNKGKQLRAALR